MTESSLIRPVMDSNSQVKYQVLGQIPAQALSLCQGVYALVDIQEATSACQVQE
jgi:hypothetical protein